MGEVSGPKFSVNQVNFRSIQEQPTPEIQDKTEEKALQQNNEISNAEGVSGRSLLIKDADNINNDLKALVENPQIAENSDKLFETAYAVAKEKGIENPYEEAATAATTAV